ncbi:related to meiosis-specific MutS homolog [Ustilago trichophora]|uniref:Related to meiosis-specific MutS homolog n=1 Tax=Ustilago trichophora TaxID=86804 RepID=A0A5C3EPY7_9BASI|nr:related to meiosis-specific MutS homolog [Ustilago trichophora]
MENNGRPSRLPPQIWRPDQVQAEIRPDTAGSVASSTSSFHIPGVTPMPQGLQSQKLQPAASRATTPTFLRLFTPQGDDPDTLFRSRGRNSTPPVDWLAKHGPSPREFLESSQGTPRYLRDPQTSLGRADVRPNRTTMPSISIAGPPVLDQTEDQVRPFTASSYHRSKLVTADGSVGNYVCAVLENRGTGREVGIASIERETGLCVITQFADTPTYVRTIHHLSMYPPSTLLVPATGRESFKSTTSSSASRVPKRFRKSDDQGTSSVDDTASQTSSKSILIRCLEELFGIEAQSFPRRHWNYQEGARYLDRLLVDDTEVIKEDGDEFPPAPLQDRPAHSQQLQRPTSSRPQTGRPQTGRTSLDLNAKASTRAAILVAVANKFFLLSAVAGLFDYYTHHFNRVFTPKSLRIRFVVPDGINTAHDLELVRNLIDPKSKDSLYGLLDQCASPMGKRLLKMNILQPLTDLDAIAARQDAVAECLRNEERLFAIRESLMPIRDKSIDLDKLLHTLSVPVKRETATRADTEKKISSIFSLRTLLQSLSPVRAALQNSSSGLLQAVSGFLEAEQLDAISESIQSTIDEDVLHAKGGLGSRNAQMYAVRAERSPLLDVARETYNENIESCPLQRLNFNTGDSGLNLSLKMIANGFLFQTRLDRSQMNRIPPHFTNVTRAKSGQLVTMMTVALKKLNARLADSMNEVCTMSEVIIEALIEEILVQVGPLYKVSEALSLLDMIISFARVSEANSYIRPTFGDRIDIRNARHPILDRVDIVSMVANGVVTRRRTEFVPNDIYLAPGERVCLVTGPNMSGKSTFLRQIALITVLAGIGCFVPATRATLPIPDAILSLLTHEDDATQNLSTFAAEMRTSAFILSVGTPRSLIILDEMGRGTSPDEGCAVATAIIEEMISEKGSTVFFATHFGELVEGLDGKEGVVCQHLQVSTVQRNDNVGLVFHHKLHLGPGLNTHYSLQVARMMGCFSAEFLERAQGVAMTEQMVNANRAAIVDGQTRERRKLMRRAVRDLRRLLQGAALDDFASNEAEEDGQVSQPLIEKLCQLQIHTTTELEATFDD